ncbi:hypothetical protein [Rhizocola hellebori]|nr:hypothetical protein [Rhizocola hellebori]
MAVGANAGDAEPGEVRLDDRGNLEVFDGKTWSVVSSIYEGADDGIRTDPDPWQRRGYRA